jgi:hypothetical protein
LQERSKSRGPAQPVGTGRGSGGTWNQINRVLMSRTLECEPVPGDPSYHFVSLLRSILLQVH